jgi:hypothetical protein
MKGISTLLATLCLMQSVHAQTITSAVPGFISYQGRALNSAGTVMGSGTPVNRTVTFRIWDHASNSLTANLIYSEQQVVTIAEGEFSVLVGAGSVTAGTPLGYSETAKGPPTVKINDLSVFAGVNRFLGVTIDDGTVAVDNEVSPRQQIVSSAYALRARYAEQLGSNGGTALTALDSGNVGIGNTNPPARFTVTAAGTGTSTPQLLLTADDITERLRIGVDSTGTGTGYIQSFKEGIGAQNLLLNPSGGFVGIGTTTPAVALSVVGAITGTGAITGGSFSTAGAITATGAITGGSLTTAGTISATGAITGGSFSSAGAITATTNFVTNAGNIGIGTTTPGTRLQIDDGLNTGPYASATITRPTNSHTGSHMAFVRSAAQVMGVGYAPSLNTFGFGQGVSGVAFSPGYLAIDQNNGNVGIGIASPTAKLDVNGNAYLRGQFNLDGSIVMGNGPSIYGTNSLGVAEQAFWPRSSDGTYINYGTNGFFIRNNASTNTMVMLNNGNVQIGTSTLSAARLNVGSVLASVYINGYLDTNGGQSGDSTTNRNLSIQADGTIISPFVAVNSDLRIKTNLRPSDSGKDLATLMGIAVTDYQLKDKVAHGKGTQKKVIAQQVETIYPQAVLQTTNVVPDLYKKAAVKNGWVELATDLKKGDRVKLIGKTDQSVHEVLEIRDGAFRPDGKVNDEEVFVYGREVSDFRNVDYDAIAMLNVSATQELARQLKTVQNENAALRRELAAKEESMEARLIALEARLPKDSAPAPVSLKTVSTSK